MEHSLVKAKCLFCNATVAERQESMNGFWNSYDDFEPVWKGNNRDLEKSGWLWHQLGRADKYQDFYLCPRHNTAEQFVQALVWAGKQIASGKYIDFTEELSPVLATQPVSKGY